MSAVHTRLVAELESRGVDTVFGLVGDDILLFGVELEQSAIRYIAVRHEAMAVSMADGYSRTTDRLGVAMVSRGPGFTNALTSVVIASRARSKVVVITSESDPSMRGTVYSKWIDQPGIYASSEVASVSLATPTTAVADFGALLDRAMEGVTIIASFRGDVINQEADDLPSSADLPAVHRGIPPAAEDIAMVADLLAETTTFRRILILAGRGAVKAHAREELERLAELTGALLGTTLMGKAYFADNPFSVGICGGFATDTAVEILSRTDLLLSFGSSMDSYTTGGGTLFGDARLIQIDVDASRASQSSIEPDLFIEADAKIAATALVAELTARGHAETGQRTPGMADRLAAVTDRAVKDVGVPGALDPRVVMQRLDALLPVERTVVIDGGHHMMWSTRHLSVPDPWAFVLPLEFYAIGAATGLAIGAAVARPDRLLVYCAGDAGLMMSLAEIETAARHRIPMVILVINDSALGAELQILIDQDLPDGIGRIETPSFADAAHSLGAKGIMVDSNTDLDNISDALVGLDRPLVIDVRVTTDVRSDDYFMVW